MIINGDINAYACYLPSMHMIITNFLFFYKIWIAAWHMAPDQVIIYDHLW